jgi:hypothetical protein
MVARKENLVSISQAYILGERHWDFFDAVRAVALTKKDALTPLVSSSLTDYDAPSRRGRR